MWKWTFKYPNGKTSDSLVVPINKSVKLNLISKDVLHSLYIPAFRIKQDVVPGVDNMMWFIGQKLGTYDILCAEYCGQLHSYMLSTVSVIEHDDYDNWLVSSPDTRDEHPGLTLLKNNACLSCHTRDGSRLVGPSFKNLLGRNETIIIDGDEKQITVDNQYIIDKLNSPSSSTVASYQSGLMTPYGEILSDEDMNNIIEYFSTLK